MCVVIECFHMYLYKYARNNKQTTNCPLSHPIIINVKNTFFVLYLQHSSLFILMYVFMSPHIHTYIRTYIYFKGPL